jgi:O-antigen/teichoic acid export membrane protein
MVEDRKPIRAGNDQFRKIVIFSDISHRIKNSEFVGRVSAMSLARSLPTLSAFVVLFVLARYLLDPDELAHYRKLWPFFSLWGPVVISAIVNAAYFRGSDPAHARVALRQTALMFLLGGMMVGGSAWVLSNYLAVFFQVPFLADAYALFGVYAMVAIWGAITEPLFVLSGRRQYLPAVAAIFTTVDVAAILIPFSTGADLMTVVSWMIIAQVARQLVLMPLFVKWYTGSARENGKSSLLDGKVLSYAGGMALLSLSGVGASEIDRFIVGRFLDDTAFILYDVGARKLPFITILTASVTSAIVAGYASQVAEGSYSGALHKIKRSTTSLVRLLLPTVMFLAIAAEPFVALIFGESYAGSGVVFAWFLFALLSNMFFPHSLVMATGRVRINVMGALFELLVNIILSLLLVRDFGIAGVAFASAVAHWCYTLAMAVYCKLRLDVGIKAFLPDSLGLAFYLMVLFSGVLAWLSLGVAMEFLPIFYLPVALATLWAAKKIE